MYSLTMQSAPTRSQVRSEIEATAKFLDPSYTSSSSHGLPGHLSQFGTGSPGAGTNGNGLHRRRREDRKRYRIGITRLNGTVSILLFIGGIRRDCPTFWC